MASISYKGFTLSELLITLGILGIIATFTIPKVLSVITGNNYKQRVQVAASMISGAYTKYQQDNVVTAGMKPSDLTPYMNYVKFDTSGTVLDDHYTLNGTGGTCIGASPCVLLHNGARIRFYDPESFGQLAPGYAIIFQVDPDGVLTDNTTNNNGKMIELYLYATNGRIATRGEIDNPTSSSILSRAPVPAYISPWFSWN